MAGAFEDYLRALRQTPLEDHTEHTGRSALEALLNRFAGEAGPGIAVQHEPKREADKGAPDFKIKRKGMILGYVEVKEVGTNLDRVLKSDQIKRYRTLSDNILLTDYLQWIWIDREHVKGREILAYPTDLEARKLRLAPERAEAVGKLISAFFSEAPQGIGQSEQLALALAARSRLLRDFLGEELVRQEREHKEGRLYGLFQIFRDQVFHELTLQEFADAFAQMLAYGLFLARLSSDSEPVTLNNARQHVPGSFRLIRELVDFLTVLDQPQYKTIAWVVDEVLSIVNGLRLADIHEDLSFRQRKAISRKVRAADEEEHRLFERDPFIYFYEDYLKAYDKDMRKGRGVYYTPPPVVNFIVRAIDDILKRSFDIRDGLADHRRVTVLDFACGTGTFLLEVFQRAFDNIGGAEAGRAELMVREHFLTNIFGFEYLIAPYTVAHLKLSQYLKDKGHPLHDDERLQVFLTNTLEPVEAQENWLLPAVTAEVKAAQKIKDRDILVITGNPPYSGHSKNKGRWISAAIDRYKFTLETDEAGREIRKSLGERNPKWLNDDYVKFIRFAQLKMDAVEEGVVGIITNHSWLDNPTFRGMRQSLMRSFEQIYVLDLHGNAKKKERTPDGSKDENVFDIEQGVAISLFVKRPGLDRGVWRGDLWGTRLEKYHAAAGYSKEGVEWQQSTPVSPRYSFSKEDAEHRANYDRGWALPSMLTLKSVGIVTGRDRLAVHFSNAEAFDTVQRFSTMSPEEARGEFNLGPDAQDWKITWAQEDIRSTGTDQKNLIRIAYQPFDLRWTYYTGKPSGFHVRPRRAVSDKMLSRNLAIISNRSQEIPGEWSNVLVVNVPATHHTVSNKEVNTVFPLYSQSVEVQENLSPDFRGFIDERYEHHYTPEEILGYIYAVLHAPTYRARYAEFLRIDFPRVPFPETAEAFEALSVLGWELVQAHLLREVPRKGLAAYHGRGDHTVESVRYAPADEAVRINETQFFKPVPREVWEFRIGGYQVLDKYLKSRKGRTLTLDEITHIGEVADALAFTVDQMARIDETYRAALADGDN